MEKHTENNFLTAQIINLFQLKRQDFAFCYVS